MIDKTIVEKLAKDMHDWYEQAAVEVGWETQESCKLRSWEALPEDNKKVMLLVAKKVLEVWMVWRRGVSDED